MKIKEIQIYNILSIESAKLSFEDNGLVLVEGWNYDAERSNGAGKTAIFNALAFALYDKIPRKITASEILKRGAKTGKVVVTLECGKDVWRVERSRPKGVAFYRGEEQAQITQEEWENNLRLTYDQFLMSMYCAQNAEGYNPRFLLTPDTDKKRFLLQLLNLNIFSEAKKTTDLKIKTIQQELLSLKESSVNLNSKIEAYEESLCDKDKVNSSISILQEEINSFNEKIKELSDIPKPDVSKFEKIEDDLKDKQANLTKTRFKRSSLHDKYMELQAQQHPFDKKASCTECGASLATAEAAEKHAKHQSKIQENLVSLKAEIDECDELLYKEPEIKQLQIKLKNKKNIELAEYQDAILNISELKSLVRSKKNEVESFFVKLSNNDKLLNKINALRKQASEVDAKKHASLLSLEFYETISSIYSPTGAQAYILDSIIDFFNESVEKNISLIWPNASYSLISYKETAKGDITAKFSEKLTMDGKDVSVGSLSGGELKALSLCIDFSILDILESQFGISLNPIILDEPFDGLDSIGRSIVMELLTKLAENRQIFVIDHANELKASFGKTLKVEKKAGTSSVIDYL